MINITDKQFDGEGNAAEGITPENHALEKIPQCLKDIPQWLVWKAFPNQATDKIAKIPVNVEGTKISGKDPNNQMSFEEASACAQLFCLGIGFQFSEESSVCGVDFDNCIDPGTGEVDPQVADTIQKLNSYTEISPSGTGFHVICNAGCVHTGVNDGIIEMYSQDHFFTVTGNQYSGDNVNDASVEYQRLLDQHSHPTSAVFETPEEWTTEPKQEYTPFASDEELIQKARSSTTVKQAFGGDINFEQIWNAVEVALSKAWSTDDSRPYDCSSADASLASRLMFWTGCNCEHVLQLMWRSGLVRDKWSKNKGYLKRTILSAYRNHIQREGGVYTAGVAMDNTTFSQGGVDELTLEVLERCSYTMKQERSIYFPEQERVLGDWLVNNSLNMIHGGSGIGKTWVVLATLLSLATGKMIMPNWEVHCTPMKVLLVDGEMEPADLRKRKFELLEGIGHQNDLDNFVTTSNIHMVREGFKFLDLSNTEDRNTLTAFILKHKFKFVSLDNLSCLIPGINIKASEEYSPFNAWLVKMKAYGVVMQFVHHDNKSEDFTGANEMTFQLQTRLHVKKKSDGFIIYYPKGRHMVGKDVVGYTIIKGENGGLCIATDKGEVGTCVELAVSYVQDAEDGVTEKDLVQFIEDQGKSKRALKDMLRKQKESKRQNKKIWLRNGRWYPQRQYSAPPSPPSL